MIKESDLEPELGPLHFYIDAYSELASCKPSGVGPAPIPFTAIVEYARIYEIFDFEEFLFIIRCVDNCVISKQEKDGKNGKQNSN